MNVEYQTKTLPKRNMNNDGEWLNFRLNTGGKKRNQLPRKMQSNG